MAMSRRSRGGPEQQSRWHRTLGAVNLYKCFYSIVLETVSPVVSAGSQTTGDSAPAPRDACGPAGPAYSHGLAGSPAPRKVLHEVHEQAQR